MIDAFPHCEYSLSVCVHLKDVQNPSATAHNQGEVLEKRPGCARIRRRRPNLRGGIAHRRSKQKAAFLSGRDSLAGPTREANVGLLQGSGRMDNAVVFVDLLVVAQVGVMAVGGTSGRFCSESQSFIEECYPSACSLCDPRCMVE